LVLHCRSISRSAGTTSRTGDAVPPPPTRRSRACQADQKGIPGRGGADRSQNVPMPIHKLDIRLPSNTIINTDVAIDVYSNGPMLGALFISKGSLDWRPARHQAAYRIGWEKFDLLMREKGADERSDDSPGRARNNSFPSGVVPVHTGAHPRLLACWPPHRSGIATVPEGRWREVTDRGRLLPHDGSSTT
jgi:hypothetical protein